MKYQKIQELTFLVNEDKLLNNNLSGFKFYPTGTELVALVADDSFYKDENGKYVLADSPTGQSMIENEPSTYKALASTEDCRGEAGADTATPFKSIGKQETVTITATVTSSSPMSNNFIAYFNNIKLVGILSVSKNTEQGWGFITKVEKTTDNEVTIKVRKYGSGSYGTMNITVIGIGG